MQRPRRCVLLVEGSSDHHLVRNLWLADGRDRGRCPRWAPESPRGVPRLSAGFRSGAVGRGRGCGRERSRSLAGVLPVSRKRGLPARSQGTCSRRTRSSPARASRFRCRYLADARQRLGRSIGRFRRRARQRHGSLVAAGGAGRRRYSPGRGAVQASASFQGVCSHVAGMAERTGGADRAGCHEKSRGPECPACCGPAELVGSIVQSR
jgi:hypothetical protein